MRMDIFTPKYKTNVLPLRWFADSLMHPISMWFFHIALRANDRFTYEYQSYKFRHNLMEKVGWRGYKIFDYPYSKWGTTYSLNISAINEMYSTGWKDYENGIPYWDYDWHEDPKTGDAWRLVERKEL